MTDPGIKPGPRVRTSRVGLVLWPYEPRSKAYEQSRERTAHHGAGLDEVQVGATDAERGRLGVGLGPDAGLGPAERGDRVLLLVLQAPALRTAPLALGLPGLGEGVELALGEFPPAAAALASPMNGGF